MNKNYIILPGANRTPYHYWYGWLFNKIYEKTPNVKTITFPTLEKLSFKNWCKVFNTYVKLGIINNNSVIIAHSTASIFIVRYLIKYHLKVNTLIFVSGFNSLKFNKIADPEIANIILSSNKTFVMENLKIDKVKKYTKSITCFVSDNDPIIPMQELKKFAQKLDAKIINIKDGGHFNDESGYLQFDELLKELDLK